jgi:uncharacterized repeat protein (TIGR03803 family)
MTTLKIRFVNSARFLAIGSALILAVLLASVIGSSAQVTLTTLVTFQGRSNGAYPSSLVQGTDGNFYGTTEAGGTYCYSFGQAGCGTVFKITPEGTLTTLYNFCSHSNCTDGIWPYAGLTVGTDGNFYGTTALGGADGELGLGTFFQITPAGRLTTRYSFCSQPDCADGSKPEAALVLAADGNFYGTTTNGGNVYDGATGYCPASYGCGTLFKITTSGKLITLYSFCSQPGCADGSDPLAPLVQAADGNFYGTTYEGGAGSSGTVFEITRAGALTTLYSFCGYPCPEGGLPSAGLVQATNGNFYGTALWGPNGEGMVFEMTPAGTLTTLYGFCSKPNCADGNFPWAGLVQATDGNLYGTAGLGGANYAGTLFKITPTGTMIILHSFCSESDCADGSSPATALVQGTNGILYGTTGDAIYYGSAGGTVFSLSPGLAPFVGMQPGTGNVGTKVIILGNDLVGATGVSFHGVPARFTVVSSTEIVATVPTGATSGEIEVATSDGMLKSSVPFNVTP